MVEDYTGFERRRYIRLGTVFPVEFQVVSLDGSQVSSEFAQSFTRNVNEGGMCLEVNNLDEELAEKISSKAVKLSLRINMPFSEKPISATAQVAWISKIKQDYPNKFLIGISYETISDVERKHILNYAKALRLRPKLIAAAIVILAIAVATSSVLVSKKEALRREAERRIVLIEQERGKLTEELEKLQQSRSELELKLAGFLEEREGLEKKIELARAEARPDDVLKLETELAEAQDKVEELNKQLSRVAADKVKFEDQLKALEEIKAAKPVKVALAKGGVVIGKVALETEDIVKVEVRDGVITLRRDQIASITPATEEEITELVRERARQLRRAQELERQRQLRREEIIRKEEEKEIKKPSAFTVQRAISEKGVVIKNNRIYVDGSLFFIKGVAYGTRMLLAEQGAKSSTLNDKALNFFENDFKMMKEAGINTIRTYEPLPDSLLDLAEKYDLKVIEQLVYPSAATDYSSDVELKTLKRNAVEIVKRHKDKKCILMWLIWNDAPFIYESAGNPIPHYGFEAVNNFMKEIYLAIKKEDKTRPVTAANILDVEGYNLGFDFLDVIGCNAYIGGHGYEWKGRSDALRTCMKMVKIANKYKKPVFITETGYSTFVKKEVQDKALEVQIKSVDENLAGIIIFEWADEWWKGGNPAAHNEHIEEHWGIITQDRKPKSGFKAVSELFNSISTNSLGYSENIP
ncbi:MAG: hypothetical protein AMJ78_05080 [Omnitrophica WOR_2 bacterium SM23_29]|nr:MAG: hypothetical protein AMJ78_05080 [Omnitrophica WOR_2 bacterium SM23_29]